MKVPSQSLDKLTILGFSEGIIAIVTEIAYEALGCRNFRIVENVEVPKSGKPYAWEGFEVICLNQSEFAFEGTDASVFFGVPTPHIKYILEKYFAEKFAILRPHFASLIHPSAYFSRSSNAAEGLLLEPLSVVSSLTRIGFGVTIKRNCSVGHHCEFEDYVSLHPGVNVSSNVHLGQGVTLGTGTTVFDHVTIGDKTVIGAGSVVTKDIPAGVIAFGNPCRVIKPNTRWDKVSSLLKEMGVS